MVVNNSIKYSNAPDYGLDGPFDGVKVKSDRQSGWFVRTKYSGVGIRGIHDRIVADNVAEALDRAAVAAVEEYKLENGIS